jgi:hypothetical protein
MSGKMAKGAPLAAPTQPNRYCRRQFSGKSHAAQPCGPADKAPLLLEEGTALGSVPRDKLAMTPQECSSVIGKCSSASGSANQKKLQRMARPSSKVNVSCAGEGELLARPAPPVELPISPH